ncbi:DUF885 domain-containing protein [Sphingomonas sp. ID0503]|uniref:DUF885 domain-containing protein n=1 Tax=Sphingomonas sp. ID0503 TaxID=3399691 RepID=UPI003AFAAEA2
MRWLIGMALVMAGPAAASPADDLAAVIADHWQWTLRTYPTLASTLGDRRYDGKLADRSVAGMAAQAGEATALLKRVDAIPEAGLDATQRVNKAILRRLLDEAVTGSRFPERMVQFSSYSSPWQEFAGLADDLPFATKADYRSYVDRLKAYPAQMGQVIATGDAAITTKVTQPCETLGGLAGSISGLIAEPEATRYYAPFGRKKPADASAAEWAALQTEGRAAIRDVVIPQNRTLLEWANARYLPACRKTAGASTLPEGEAWYAWRVKVETTTEMTPDQVHALGQSEVARIRAEMDGVAAKAGYPSRQAMIASMKSDPKYFAKTPEEMLAAAARMAKIIDGKMPALFTHLPRLPYGVRAIPAETAEGTTTAYYSPGSPASGIAGNYYVNTSKLDQRPLWELPALTSHEAVPGHHHQIALQQELDLPDFRRHVAYFTAFTEGWGLYSEHLGLDIGLYDTPEKDMGRLSYEMWRACRLVVDTGLHAKGWTKDQAVAFMRDNSALTDANIDAEVNRYISWPGQALGYKVGELRFRALRDKAEKALGPGFNLRRFNDAVVAQGSVPMDVLEAQIDGWIAAGGQEGGGVTAAFGGRQPK